MRWEGSTYPKGRKWWIKIKRLGEEKFSAAPTPFRLDDPEGKAKADALRGHAREQWEAHQRANDGRGGPLTVQAWCDRWLSRREASGIDDVTKQRQRLQDHVYPSIGTIPLPDLRRLQVRQLMAAIREKPISSRTRDAPPERMAARTILHVYRDLRQAIKAAVMEELLDTNPVDLERNELPKKADKDPAWRVTAVLTLDEVERLISDPRVPEDRRVLYALEFLTGSRPGETAALRWAAWDRSLKPLGCITISRAYSTKRRAEKSTKTRRPRLVPVHPTLARVLAAWKLSGFARFTGVAPTPGDLVVPSATGRNRNASFSYARWMDDLAALGLRDRRHYDTRRTFRSLAGNAGAPKDHVRWITHTPGDQLDDYNSPSWDALCAAVEAVPVRLRERGTVRRAR